jgi:hypothetical protein
VLALFNTERGERSLFLRIKALVVENTVRNITRSLLSNSAEISINVPLIVKVRDCGELATPLLTVKPAGVYSITLHSTCTAPVYKLIFICQKNSLPALSRILQIFVGIF